MTTIHINVPYSMLLQRIDFAIKNRINPEIYFSAEDLDTCQEKDVRQLAETLHRNGLEISIHGPFMDLSPGGVDQRSQRDYPGSILKDDRIGPLL